MTNSNVDTEYFDILEVSGSQSIPDIDIFNPKQRSISRDKENKQLYHFFKRGIDICGAMVRTSMSYSNYIGTCH